jgi:calcineurin-like phosphoesterase family protein
VRLGLIGDTHGYVPALEAAIAGCRQAGVDRVIHCGDFLSTPFSPDPPDETIALLRAEEVTAIQGNGEIYLSHWNTPHWEATLAQRLRRPDSPPRFLPFVAAGQAALSSDSLAWLRQLPGERVLDCAHPGDVYVCHAMPGDPFSTIWDTDPQFTPVFPPDEIERVLSRPEVAGADLILCGHVPYPLVHRTPLPNGRVALVVRGVGWMRGEPDGSGWMVDYWILEAVGPASLGFRSWALQRHLRPFRPRDPNWTDSALMTGRVP